MPFSLPVTFSSPLWILKPLELSFCNLSKISIYSFWLFSLAPRNRGFFLTLQVEHVCVCIIFTIKRILWWFLNLARPLQLSMNDYLLDLKIWSFYLLWRNHIKEHYFSSSSCNHIFMIRMFGCHLRILTLWYKHLYLLEYRYLVTVSEKHRVAKFSLKHLFLNFLKNSF